MSAAVRLDSRGRLSPATEAALAALLPPRTKNDRTRLEAGLEWLGFAWGDGCWLLHQRAWWSDAERWCEYGELGSAINAPQAQRVAGLIIEAGRRARAQAASQPSLGLA